MDIFDKHGNYKFSQELVEYQNTIQNLGGMTLYDDCSEITFKEVCENLSYSKVVWNGKVVYDDTTDIEGATYEELVKFKDTYNDKIIYAMILQVTDFHHFIIDVIGEKV